MSDDHYSILGLDKNCTIDDITHAYRIHALEWHPDRNDKPDAAIMFQKITEAYNVLSNPDKKRQYDSRKIFGSGSGSGVTVMRFTSNNANEVFEKLKPQIREVETTTSRPILTVKCNESAGSKIPLSCSLEEIYIGKKKIIKTIQGKLMIVQIPVGCPEGQCISVKNADTGNDDVFVVRVLKHNRYHRDGNDLHMTETISLSDLINGFSLTITLLNGKKKKISHKYGGKTIGPDFGIKIPNMGMSILGCNVYGNLFIHFKIVLPDSL
jgi:DnaJ-class molecular chaperone